ncbi:radial spoke head protein 9 homolog [Adelges cooleyi]|uniref:radial spoke head protein 9 homolog n=1 Tax=Adelges cooleyi TaxID=133065 RepID=UPI0021805583|nr:radial spoke head protein 9 homolog [Adelges cooleyi]
MLKTANCSINEDLVPVLYDSLIRLQSKNHFNSVYLWGRLQTLSDDYFLAYGHYGNPVNKKNVFLQVNFQWSVRHVQMVNLFKPWTEQMAEDITPSNMSADVYGEGEEIVPEGRSKKEISGSRDSDATKMIKEEDRLAVAVDMIENETHVVLRGFLYKLPNGNIVNAPCYKGLDHSEIDDLRNFLHLKEQFPSAKGSESKAKLRCYYNASIDMLESIENDIPKDCWAARIIFNRYFVMHNLLWPGAVFFQDMNTGVHGFFYNGDGIKNLDLPFMLKC